MMNIRRQDGEYFRAQNSISRSPCNKLRKAVLKADIFLKLRALSRPNSLPFVGVKIQ